MYVLHQMGEKRILPIYEVGHHENTRKLCIDFRVNMIFHDYMDLLLVISAPCPPNHYSLEGSATCLKCKLGYYQPNYGSKNCKPSFKGVQNIKLMNLSSNWNWKTFVVIVVAFVLLIAICCFIQQVMILFMPLRMAFKCK